MNKKIYIIAGEASGDSHGAHLVKFLRKLDPNLSFYGLGGTKMSDAGVKIDHDLTKISALGLTDVLLNYFTYRKIFYKALEHVAVLKPDLVILIDYPGFNIRFAKALKSKIPIIYYISPQIWAWGGRRISTIKKYVNKMLVFFPFEKNLYDSHGLSCAYVGHPLTDEITDSDRSSSEVLKQLNIDKGPVLGLLPGSREKEVKRILRPLLEGALKLKKKYNNLNIVLSESNNIPTSVYDEITNNFKNTLNLKRLRGNSYAVIRASNLLCVTSGTATLETALHEKPFILVYKAAWLTYFLGRMLIRIPFLGIINILLNKRAVPELIQFKLTPENVFKELDNLLSNENAQALQIYSFKAVRRLLSVGNSSSLAANEIINFLSHQATPTTPSKKT